MKSILLFDQITLSGHEVWMKGCMSEVDSSNDDIETRVLDAASELFVHFGYDKTTINDIAAKAGVSKSTIYLRWKKKEDIFEALLFRESQLVMRDWIQRVEADPKGGSIGTWLRHAISASFGNPFLIAVYRRDRRILGRMIQQIGEEEAFVRRQGLFIQMFQEMQAVNGIRKDLDLHAIAYMMNALHFGLIHFADMVPEEHTPPLENVWQVMVEMTERMMQPEDGGDSEAAKQVIRRFMQNIQAFLDEMMRHKH